MSDITNTLNIIINKYVDKHKSEDEILGRLCDLRIGIDSLEDELDKHKTESTRRGNLLEDVVNQVAYTEKGFYTENNLYTEPEPALMVKKALEWKDLEIKCLYQGFERIGEK